MDTNVFAPSDTRDAEVADVLRCLDEDLKIPITAAVAVARHVAILGLLVSALLALAVTYCFALTWLVLLFLQAQLLTLTAQLLASTMVDEKFPTTQPAVHPLKKQAVETPGGIAETSIPPEQRVTTPNQKPHDEESQPLRRQDVQAELSEPVAEIDSQLQNLEPAVDTNGDIAEATLMAGYSTTLDQHPTTSSSWLSFGDSTHPRTTANHFDPLDGGQEQTKIKMSPEQSRRLDQNRRDSEQSSFVSMMLNRPNRLQKELPTDAATPAAHEGPDRPPRSNPFNVTSDDLEEARRFSAEISRPGPKKPRGAGRNQRLETGNASKPVVRRQAAAQPTILFNRTPRPEGWVPPHKRKILGVEAKTVASEQPVASDAAAAEGKGEAAEAKSEENTDVFETIFEHHNMKSSEDKGPAADLARVASQDEAEAETQERSRLSIDGFGNTSDSSPGVQHEAAATNAPFRYGMSNEALRALDTKPAVGGDLWKRIELAQHTILCPNNPCNDPSCKHKHTARPSSKDLGMKQEGIRSNAIEEVVEVVHSRLAHAASLVLSPSSDDSSQNATAFVALSPTRSPGAREATMQTQRGEDLVPLIAPEYHDHDLLSFTEEFTPAAEYMNSSPTQLDHHATTTVSPVQSPAPALLMPPGIGHALQSRQAEFDALVPGTKLANTATERATESATSHVGIRGASLLDIIGPEADRSSAACPSNSPQASLPDDTAEQHHSRTESSFNELAPKFSRHSAVQAVSFTIVHQSHEKSGTEDGDPDQMEAASALDINQPKTEDTMTASKREAKEARKAARALLKRAWLQRERARARVQGGFSFDDAQVLASATRSYLDYRSGLEKLMPGGKLNEEDSKVYPIFSGMGLEKPKVRPEGLQNLQNIGVNVDTIAVAQGVLPIDEAILDKSKASMAAARKLYIGARDKGDHKLKQATAFYAKKREALVNAYDSAGLPTDMSSLYPPSSTTYDTG